jgi:BASS family bile acid:Na+ symporter
MNVIMPLLAALIVSVMGLKHPERIALVALMISPVPPILPRRQLKVGGAQPYIYGLMVVEALLSIVLVPISVLLLGSFIRLEAPLSWSVVAKIVLLTILLPLALGLVIRQLAPAFAARIEPLVSRVGLLLLILGSLPILFFAGRYVVLLLGSGTLLATVIVSLLGLAVGHVLGGPQSSDRTVLSLATSARHPGVAMAIASSTFPDQKLVPAAILLYMLVNALVCIPYLKWIERRNRPTGTAAPVASPRDKAA